MQSDNIFQVHHDYSNISDQHVAKSLLRMAWGTAFGTLAGLVVQAIAPATSKVVVEIIGINLTRPRVAYLMLVILAMLGLVMIIRLLNRGQLSRASIVYVAVMFGIAFLAHITVQITTSIVLVLSLPIVAAGVLLDKRGLFLTVLLVCLMMSAFVLFTEIGPLDQIMTGTLTKGETVAYGMIILVVNGIMLDLFTGQHRLLQETEAARQAAEEANRVKSQFLAAMSHELRTPLNAILNFTQFVADGAVGDVNEEQVDLLNKSVESGKHLLTLINDVLDISKIEAGAFKLFVEDNVNLQQETKAVVSAGKVLLGDKPVEIVEEIEPDLPLMVGDKRRIRQIMLNLMSNACKFTEQGSIKLSVRRQNEQIVFTVQDTGSGIAAEDHDLIFEIFRQTKAGLRQGEGTGLGLPISRRLAEAHDGRLWMESSPGKGSTFYVSLPLKSDKLVPMVKAKKETAHAH